MEDYELIKERWDKLVGLIKSYKKDLEGSGVKVELPEEPKSYEEMKGKIGELEKKVEEYKELVKEYKGLKVKVERYKKEIEGIKPELEKIGVKVEGIESMELGYLRERVPKLDMELENYKSLLEDYEKLKNRWKKLKVEVSELIKAGAKIKVGPMPRNIYKLTQEITRLEDILGKYPKNINIEVSIGGEVVNGEWSKVFLTLRNKGGFRAEEINIEYTGNLKVTGISKLKSLEPDEEIKLNLRILTNDSGYVPLEVILRYKNPYTNKIEKKKIMPELYVKRNISIYKDKSEESSVGKNTPYDKIGLEEIRKIYGINKEKNYSWGKFSSYTILKRIGSGGFSEIYLAENNGKKYALKIPKGVDWKKGETLVLDKEEMNIYAKEAEIWAMLTERVPRAVINLVDAGVEPFPWFAMELGKNNLMEVFRKVSYEEKIKIMIELLGKLDKIHHFGVVHKDIKPENILHANGEWKFTDFGLSKIINKSSKSSKLMSGTLFYMAPEQISKKKFGGTDWRTDIWQMGVMMYELLTGHMPFEVEDPGELAMSIIMESPKPATEYGVDEKIWKVMEKALQKKKEDRWQSAAEMKRALEEVFK